MNAFSFVTEQEQDEAMERLRKERELRKKKEEEDSLNLEQTKEQVSVQGCDRCVFGIYLLLLDSVLAFK